jgi:hypothetical protein
MKKALSDAGPARNDGGLMPVAIQYSGDTHGG